MKKAKFRFLLWQRNSDGTWTLRSRSATRARVERTIRRIPRSAVWRMVDVQNGLLAQSLVQA